MGWVAARGLVGGAATARCEGAGEDGVLSELLSAALPVSELAAPSAGLLLASAPVEGVSESLAGGAAFVAAGFAAELSGAAVELGEAWAGGCVGGTVWIAGEFDA